MDSKVSGRYAKSLLELSTHNSNQNQVYADMALIAETTSVSRDLSLLFKNPIINQDKKIAVIKALFSGKVSELSMTFMTLIVNKGREYFLEETANKFVSIYKTQTGIEVAHLTTAIPIDEEMRKKVIALINEIAPEKEIELNEYVKPNIIGGFILKVGDRQYDSSVSRKINELRMEFVENLYLKDY